MTPRIRPSTGWPFQGPGRGLAAPSARLAVMMLGRFGALIILLLTAMPETGRAEESGPSKVVVLGFDGADAAMVRDWMDAGHLPNLARLRREGTYAPLLPTNPPQTPVSWSSFSTGRDPGGTRIFDFLKRNLDDYRPDFAMTTPSEAPFLFGEKNPLYLALAASGLALLLGGLLVGAVSRRAWAGLVFGLIAGGAAFPFAKGFVSENVPLKRPIAINQREGKPFWQVLGEAGIHSTIIRVPQTFPPDPNPGGHLLSGLGVPDIRGTFGTYTLYTSDVFGGQKGGADTEMGGKVILVDVEPGDAEVETFINGPFNKLFDTPPEIRLPLHVALDWQQKQATLGFEGETVTLREGEWSDFVRFTFPIRKLVRIQGIARFYLLEMGEHFRLYMSPINLDPIDPVVPVTYPDAFSKEIYDRIGNYKTLGWALDTWALNEEVTTEEIFAEDLEATVGQWEAILDAFLENPDERLYCQVFYFTDRVAHCFYRFLDPTHPAYDPELADEWSDYILESYQRMDEIVGKVLARLPEDGLLLICSDHGFANWKRSFNMNTWLVRNGFMTLRPVTKPGSDAPLTLDDLFVEGQFWPNVDWERTQAYAVGLGAIYVNLLGREKEGIVSPGAEYDEVCRRLASAMEAYVDPETGERPISKVYHRDEMYVPGYDPDLIPDLRAANNPNYRVSWQTSLGGIPKEMFETNTDKWSGDHCSLDPELVKGILFSNRPLALGDRQPRIEDLFSTIVSAFGVPLPAGTVGVSLLD